MIIKIHLNFIISSKHVFSIKKRFFCINNSVNKYIRKYNKHSKPLSTKFHYNRNDKNYRPDDNLYTTLQEDPKQQNNYLNDIDRHFKNIKIKKSRGTQTDIIQTNSIKTQTNETQMDNINTNTNPNININTNPNININTNTNPNINININSIEPQPDTTIFTFPINDIITTLIRHQDPQKVMTKMKLLEKLFDEV
jgi:hypothetical protein